MVKCQLHAGQIADNRFAGELLPQRFRRAIIHNQVRVAQQTGRAELKRVAIDAPIKTSAELHSGQNVAITGISPTVSLTISCHMRICSG